MREALEIEAIKCAAGDARHDYQEWYSKYKDLQRKRRATSADATQDDLINPEAAKAELAMVKQAIQETEAILAEHRLAIVESRPSPFSDADIDNAHMVLESLRANLAIYESAATGDDSTPTGGLTCG